MVELLTSALEWSWLVQVSDLTRTGTQSEAIVLPEDLVGDRLRAQHLPDQVSYNHRLGRVQWVRVLSEVEEDGLDFGPAASPFGRARRLKSARWCRAPAGKHQACRSPHLGAAVRH